MTGKVRDQVEVFEQALKDSKDERYVLRLYVAGTTARSSNAILNIKKICEEHLKGRYELEGNRHLPAADPRQRRADHRGSHAGQEAPPSSP